VPLSRSPNRKCQRAESGRARNGDERGVLPSSTRQREHSVAHLSHRMRRADQGPGDRPMAMRTWREGLPFAEGDFLPSAVGPVDARLRCSVSCRALLCHYADPPCEGRGDLVTDAGSRFPRQFHLPSQLVARSRCDIADPPTCDTASVSSGCQPTPKESPCQVLTCALCSFGWTPTYMPRPRPPRLARTARWPRSLAKRCANTRNATTDQGVVSAARRSSSSNIERVSSRRLYLHTYSFRYPCKCFAETA
jgi:hypothetical protein